MTVRQYGAAALCVVSLGVIGAWGQAQSTKVDFARDVQPIFEKSCQQCHGAKSQMGQLRLDSRAAAIGGGLSGKVNISEGGGHRGAGADADGGPAS
jgi:mono/diheme cytochrome c family protein